MTPEQVDAVAVAIGRVIAKEEAPRGIDGLSRATLVEEMAQGMKQALRPHAEAAIMALRKAVN